MALCFAGRKYVLHAANTLHGNNASITDILCGILQCRRSGRAGRPPVKAMGERLSYGVRPRLCFFWHMSRLGGSELSQALRPTDLGMCYFQESLRLSSVALV
jgi:hypothetical protein